jgi:hypothetical protein
MTISITVKNNDSCPEAVVAVQTLDAAGNAVAGVSSRELRGGEECEIYVHSTQQLRVQEIKNG